MNGGAVGKSRLTIRPNAGTSLALAVLSVIAVVPAWFGAEEAIFCLVLFPMASVWSYLKKVTIDRRQGTVTKHGRLPFTGTSRLLIEFDRVAVGCSWGKRVTYEVSLCGRGEPFKVITGQKDHCWARKRAERIARFLAMDIHDPVFRCEVGETVVQSPREPVMTPQPTNHGSFDEADVLSMRDRKAHQVAFLFAIVGLMGLCGVVFVPHLPTRVVLAACALPSVLLSLCFGFCGVLIDRRRHKVNKWLMHPRFGREYSLSDYDWVSIAVHVMQTNEETSSSRYYVRLDGTRELLRLDSFDSHEPARELARRVADFLGLEVRDLPGRTVVYPSSDYEREGL